MTKTPTQHVTMALTLCLATTPALSAATLATDGKPQMTIVLAEDAIPAERTANRSRKTRFASSV
ncbi:MAG: hypothetical protein ABIP48_03575 [Planctomycetota bacterium]